MYAYAKNPFKNASPTIVINTIYVLYLKNSELKIPIYTPTPITPADNKSSIKSLFILIKK